MNTHQAHLGHRAHLISYYLSGLGEIDYFLSLLQRFIFTGQMTGKNKGDDTLQWKMKK